MLTAASFPLHFVIIYATTGSMVLHQPCSTGTLGSAVALPQSLPNTLHRFPTHPSGTSFPPPSTHPALAELALNGFYTLEMLARCVALGSFWAYIKRPWNAFDFGMVAAGYTALIPVNDSNSGAIRALRAMRALRPLRTITRFESLRAVVICFLEVRVWWGCCVCSGGIGVVFHCVHVQACVILILVVI